MKKYFKYVVPFLICAFFMPLNGECRQRDNLYKKVTDMSEVKVYVADVKDASEKQNADKKGIKDEIENALATRGSVNFKLVNSPKEADIAVYCDVTENLWTDKDPVDMVTGIGAIAMDAMTDSEYARLTAVFTVIDPKKDKVLWEDTLKATITKKGMSEKDSVPGASPQSLTSFS